MSRFGKALLILGVLLAATLASMVARATPPNTLFGSVAICSPWNPQECSTPYGAQYTNITTATDTVVKVGAAGLAGISVNAGGAGSSATVYDNTTCTGTKIGTYSTETQTVLQIGARAGTGLCVTTSGGTPADITVLWR